MLEFFRKYQRTFFLLVTVMVITSFTFFGAYSAFETQEVVKDTAVGKTIDGTAIMSSEIQKLSRFLATDCNDSVGPGGHYPNFCNDGVIRNDFIKEGLGALLVNQYFGGMEKELSAKLEKAKRFRPYAHPEFPFLSAKTIWDITAPGLTQEMGALQAETTVTASVFSHLAKLYMFQGKMPAEHLRHILKNQQTQCSWLKADPKLYGDDLSLFGFHSASDWFGTQFVDVVSQFIVNGASYAQQKGFSVSLIDAKEDLFRNFQSSATKHKLQVNFVDHIRSLGLSEQEAVCAWQKVMLFRKLFQGVGDSIVMDELPYKDFAQFAKESAHLQTYGWATDLRTAADLAEFDLYIKTIAPKGKEPLPTTLYTVEEIEKKMPELVRTTYKAQVATVSKKEVGLRASLKEVLAWQTDHWDAIVKHFNLENVKSITSLDQQKRAEVDRFARESLVESHPEWIDEALQQALKAEKTWSVYGNESSTLKEAGKYFLVESLEKVRDKHIISFNDARAVLAKKVGKMEGDYKKEKNPFYALRAQAYEAVKKNPNDPKWVQSGSDPILDQFKLISKPQEIGRTAKESWMRNEAFLMLENTWSPICAEEDQIVFFYCHEKKIGDGPILDQLTLGQATIAADAKGYLAEQLLEKIKTKNAIVIPLEKEGQ